MVSELFKCPALLWPCLWREAAYLTEDFHSLKRPSVREVHCRFLLFTKRILLTFHCEDPTCSPRWTESQSHKQIGARGTNLFLSSQRLKNVFITQAKTSVISRVDNTPSSGARIWMLSKLWLTRLPRPAWLMRSRPEDRGCRQGSKFQQGPRQTVILVSPRGGGRKHQTRCIIQHIAKPIEQSPFFPLPLLCILIPCIFSWGKRKRGLGGGGGIKASQI